MLAQKIFKPTQGRHTGHRGYEEEQKSQLSSSSELSWERLQFANLSSAASCYNVRLFFFLHSFRNCESTPLWGHISQCRGHKKSGVTNDRKLIKNKKCDESWVLQAVTSLEPWLSTHSIHISDCICSSYDINKSSQTITSWTTELLLRIYQVVCPYRNDGRSMENSWGVYYFHQSSAPKHHLFYLWILLWQNAWFLKLLFELLALVSQKLPHEFLFGIRAEFPPIFWNVLEHTSVSLGYIFMRNEYQPQNSNRVWKTIKERGVEGETAEPQRRAEGITAWNFTNT